jgi:penicillin-binding protein 2
VGLRDLVASPEEVSARPELRWRIIGAFFLLLGTLLVVRLFFLQVVEHQAAVAAVNSNSLRVTAIPAARGQIRDRSGYVLVGNVTTTQLQLSQEQARMHPGTVAAIAALTGRTVPQIRDALKSQQYLPYQPVPIVADTPPSEIAFVREHPNLFPGANLVNASTRTFPWGGAIAPQLMGYVGQITEREIAQHPNSGYRTNSVIGKNGVELFYEPDLRGRDGSETLRVDAYGNVLGATRVVPPRVGDSVVLNLDAGLQLAVDNALNAGIHRVRSNKDPRSGVYPPAPTGAAIVEDVNTGAILAMSSFPGYDLRSFYPVLSNSEFTNLEANGAFNDYAIQGLYAPGSTFKMISATAELETGIMSAGQYVDDTGTFTVPGCLQGGHGCVFHDDETTGTGTVNLPLALTRSSDYYFYNLGYLFWRYSGHYGETPIQNAAAHYGLGQQTLVDLPYEDVGRVDSPTVRLQLHREAPRAFPNFSWYTGDNVEMAFGQGSTAITPIELLTAYATLANGGTRYAPQVAAGIVTASDHVVTRYAPRAVDHVSLPPSVRGPIVAGLTGVINNPSGTGYSAFHQFANFNLAGYVLAGKTGTASNAPGQEPNSWFVGFGPVARPQYAVICVIGEGGYGADGAAPVVAQIFNYLVAHPVRPVHLTTVLTSPYSR